MSERHAGWRRRAYRTLTLLVALLIADSTMPLVLSGASASPVVDAVAVIRPVADANEVLWSKIGASTAADALDDPVLSPTAVAATDYIYASQPGRAAVLEMADLPLSAGYAETVTAWFYANTGADTRLRLKLLSNGSTLTSTTVPAGQGFAWRSVSWPRMTDQDAVNNLRLRFTSHDGGNTNVRAAYLSLDLRPCTAAMPVTGGYGSFGGGVWPDACWNPHRAGNPFNTPLPPITADRVHPNSANIINRILGDISAGDTPAHIEARTDGSYGEPT